MKILSIVDTIGWCIWFRAEAIKKFIPEYQFEIRDTVNEKVLDGWEEFDLIHFHFTYGLTNFYDFIKCNKDRMVITICNERSLLLGQGVDVKKLEELLRICGGVTSISRKIAGIYGIEYIPNGIDVDLFNKYKRPVVGYVGTTGELKNHLVIKQVCEELGLEFRTADYVDLKKMIPHDRMQDFYMGLDVYVHASLTEGFNNTIIEALSCNIPILMTKAGVWEELQEYVTLIEPTVEGVKKELMKFTGRNHILKNFLWKDIVPKYKEVYRRVYAKSRGG
jgi:glycosyltransferase involved in cell wall biosynthesis